MLRDAPAALKVEGDGQQAESSHRRRASAGVPGLMATENQRLRGKSSQAGRGHIGSAVFQSCSEMKYRFFCKNHALNILVCTFIFVARYAILLEF